MRIWRYLDEIARSGSVRNAAERLNVTPSAILRRLQDVEEDLGEVIFERTAHGMILTTAGELFISWVRRQAAELEAVRSQIDDISGLKCGHIRLVCSQAAAEDFIPRKIEEFQRTHQDVSFSVQTASHDEATRLLQHYEAELALVIAPQHRQDLKLHISVGQPMSVVMRRDHPLAAKRTISLRDCITHPFALLSASFSGRARLDRALAKLEAKPAIALEANAFEVLKSYVLHSDAVTFQLMIGVETLGPNTGLIAKPLLNEEDLYAPLALLQLRGRTLSPAAIRFANLLARDLDAMRITP